MNRKKEGPRSRQEHAAQNTRRQNLNPGEDRIQLVLSKLKSPKGSGVGRWIARCPAHEDRNPSLSISAGGDGKVLLKCHAGCSTESVVKAIGLELTDLFPRRSVVTQTIPLPKQSGATIFKSASDAVRALERRHGSRSVMWTYRSAVGDSVGSVVRFDKPDGKDFRPVSRNYSGWTIGAMTSPRPLYRLPEILQSGKQKVFVVEGEKCADAIVSVGLCATTSSGGSKAASKTDWSPLAGRQVVLLPDHDEPGERYVEDVLSALATLSPRPIIRVLRLAEHWKECDVGGDVADFIEARRGSGSDNQSILETIESLTETAPTIQAASKESLSPKWRPFPVEVLPEPLKAFVSESATAICCDASFVALPLLSAIAAAIGGSRRIMVKRGWTEPANVWTAVVGDSGTVKTPPFKAAVQFLRDAQAKYFKEYATAQTEYEKELRRYEVKEKKWKHLAQKSNQDDPPEKPVPPKCRRYVVSDTTIEALAPILLDNHRGVLLARDELAGWVRGFDQYKGGRGGDIAHWLSLHNGEAIVIDRKTGAQRTIYVPSAYLSVTGGIQPGILDRVMGTEHRDSGLLARLLFAHPPRRKRVWTEASVSESLEMRMRTLFDRLLELEMEEDDNGDPKASLIGWSDSGKAAWIKFFGEHAEEHIELTGDLSSAWSKLEGYGARLALLIHLVRSATNDPTLEDENAVDQVSVSAGVALSRWFGNEAKRLYGLFDESEGERDQRLLWEWIQTRGVPVSARDVTKGIRRFRGKPDEAEEALNGLVSNGRGRWEHSSGAGRPSKRFIFQEAQVHSRNESSVPDVPVPETASDDCGSSGFGDGDCGDKRSGPAYEVSGKCSDPNNPTHVGDESAVVESVNWDGDFSNTEAYEKAKRVAGIDPIKARGGESK